MKTLKEPVIYEIEGTSYQVDVERQLLVQTNDQANTISFIRDMQDHGTFYRLLFDLDEQRPAEDLFNENRVKVIDIPQLTALDPAGMAEKSGRTVEEISGKPDFDVLIDQDLLERRHQGVLPVITIAGEDFVVDLRLKELRHLKQLDNAISLHRTDLSPEGDEYVFFYHLTAHRPVELDPKLTEFPDNVVLARIPNELGLDPVATAASYGIEERDLLRRFPITNDLKAKIIPLADTGVPALIRQNREALQREHQENLRQRRVRRSQRI